MEATEVTKKVNAINMINNDLEYLEAEKKKLEDRIAELTQNKEAIQAELLAYCKENNKSEEQFGILWLNYFSKNEITWLDDAGLLAALKANNDTDYIKVTTKTTTSVDKAALKKAFKTNESLKETYKPFYGNKLTEYVTITTEENHTKMLEHISGNKGE